MGEGDGREMRSMGESCIPIVLVLSEAVLVLVLVLEIFRRNMSNQRA